MKVAAAHAIADLVSDEERNEDYIIPGAFDARVAQAVADAVARAARGIGGGAAVRDIACERCHRRRKGAVRAGQQTSSRPMWKPPCAARMKASRGPLQSRRWARCAENLDAARATGLPICQDTGMACVFAEIGQDVHITGGSFEEAVDEGVRQGYTEGYLRKSVVADPIRRGNTGDNTPAVLTVRLVPGDKLRLTAGAQGVRQRKHEPSCHAASQPTASRA